MNPVPTNPPPAPLRPARLPGGAGSAPAGPAGTHPNGPGGRSDPTLPRMVTLAEGFVSLFLEVEAGRRPRAHLAGVMTPMLYARLSDVWVSGGAPGVVLGVRVTGSGPTGVDLVALVRRGNRCGAVAVHLVSTRRGWLVDDVALPEQGPLPLPTYPVPADDEEDDEPMLVPTAARPRRAAQVWQPDWVEAAPSG